MIFGAVSFFFPKQYGSVSSTVFLHYGEQAVSRGVFHCEVIFQISI